uniref:uncharacterized protein LOC120948071 n=1 Tax=Anopheles coluzzii TaxID=1518534 RepID=UPI0020FFC175|nr:uncharacterized protein LOC120948071 [Anopheles coluzzii]XP_049461199.1 uncharacterized protein LOC120948071 [Anopheles coluzzii]
MLDYSRTNFLILNDLLQSSDWSFLDGNPDVNHALDMFNRKFTEHLSACCPIKRPRQGPPWGNAQLRRLKRNKSSCYRFYQNSGTQQSRLRFIAAHNVYRSYNRQLHSRFLIRIQFSLRRKPKKFWRYVDTKRKNSSLPAIVSFNGTTSCTKEETCNLFADRFMSSFATEAPGFSLDAALNNVPSDAVDVNVRDINISRDSVLKALKQVKPSYNPGPDGIPTAVLVKCSEVLAGPLARIFTLSLNQRMFPAAWKSSYMFPVHKKGDKSLVENYRGITTLPAGAKVFEVVVQNSLLNCCRSLISTRQHGFFPRRSVTTNLVEFVSHCHAAFASGA